MKKILMTNCVVCGNKDNFKSKYKILTECLSCTHVFADIDLSIDEIKEIYSDKYFFGNEYIDYLNDRRQIEKNSNIRLKTIKKFINKINTKKLFEIGCAYGFFLNKVKYNFRNVSGIDINKKSIDYAKKNFNLDVYCEDFLSIDKTIINNHDIFCLFDVIEHLKEPNKIINKISKESKKDSYIIITTGDISSLNAKVKGQNWRLIHPPSHIHYFNRKSIKKLLEKNHYDIISISYCGYYRNLGFILNKITFIKKYLGLLISLLDYFKILRYDIYLNLFDIMFIIAKKNK